MSDKISKRELELWAEERNRQDFAGRKGLEITPEGEEYLRVAKNILMQHIKDRNEDAATRIHRHIDILRRIDILQEAEKGTNSISAVLYPAFGRPWRSNFPMPDSKGIIRGRSKQVSWLKKRGYIR